MSRARTFLTPLPSTHAAQNRLASSRRQKKHGRCPAAKAVASSRKNSSVQLRPPITSRRRPLNSQRQTFFFYDAATTESYTLSLHSSSVLRRPGSARWDPPGG